jgi:hypothetical protein
MSRYKVVYHADGTRTRHVERLPLPNADALANELYILAHEYDKIELSEFAVEQCRALTPDAVQLYFDGPLLFAADVLADYARYIEMRIADRVARKLMS